MLRHEPILAFYRGFGPAAGRQVPAPWHWEQLDGIGQGKPKGFGRRMRTFAWPGRRHMGNTWSPGPCSERPAMTDFWANFAEVLLPTL